jgi:2-dehydro-3-deoxyphosphogluconate aldolase / (4S)-4-hydroxy-2-oxoglutarate aldolase
MSKLTVLHAVVDRGVVAVIRACSAEQAAAIADACVEGGITALEVTFTVPDVVQAISVLAQRFRQTDIAVGAGSVLDAETARVALLAGARFIVGPASDAETGRLCRRYQVPYFAGAATPGEVIKALEDGADIVKVFPGEVLGTAFVQAVRGPLPQAPLMPTGGVTLSNAGDWIRAGCVAVGPGSSLTRDARTSNFAAVSETARRFVQAVREARNA